MKTLHIHVHNNFLDERTWTAFRQILVVRLTIPILISSHRSSTHFRATFNSRKLYEITKGRSKMQNSSEISVSWQCPSPVEWNLLVTSLLLSFIELNSRRYERQLRHPTGPRWMCVLNGSKMKRMERSQNNVKQVLLLFRSLSTRSPKKNTISWLCDPVKGNEKCVAEGEEKIVLKIVAIRSDPKNEHERKRTAKNSLQHLRSAVIGCEWWRRGIADDVGKHDQQHLLHILE